MKKLLKKEFFIFFLGKYASEVGGRVVLKEGRRYDFGVVLDWEVGALDFIVFY